MIKYLEKEINIQDKIITHKFIDIDNNSFITEQVNLEKGRLPVYIWNIKNKVMKEKYTNITIYYDKKYKECYVLYKTLQSQCHRFGAVINNEKLNIKSFYTYEFLKNYITKDNGDIENITTIYIINEKGNVMKEYHLSINNEELKIDYSNINKTEIVNNDNTENNDTEKEIVKENDIVDNEPIIENNKSDNKDNDIVKDKKEKVEEDILEEDFDIFESAEEMWSSM